MVYLSECLMEIAHKRLESCSLKPTTLVADATSLPFPDASFDRYVSNMTVHYAPDADAFLREAVRVLSPGGLAGFTVWGHEDRSPAFTLLPSIKKKLGLVKDSAAGTPPSRSSYHMGEDDEALRQRVLAAGFSSCVVWHASSVIEATSAELFVETMIEGSNSTKQEYMGWSEEVRTQFRSEVLNAANAILERGEPVALDVCYCIAQK
jgi:ubiquinone/menaquinone biosynthesis C-methylase UbiE